MTTSQDIDPVHGSVTRDRVYRSLAFEESDVCPYYIWIDAQMMEPLARHYEDDDFRDTYIRDYTVMTEIVARRHPVGGGMFRDDYGTVWREGNIPHVEQPALGAPSLRGYTFPDLSTDEHLAALPDWFSRYHDRFRIVQLGMLFFERTWAMRGFENILVDLYEAPEFVGELLDNLEQVCARIIDRLIERFGPQIDAIGLSEDYGGEHAMLLSPAMWRRFIKPRLARLVAKIRAAGKKVYIHSCGHVVPIIPDLIEIGVDMLQPLQPEAMDIFALKREFGRDLCLVGGISAQRTIPFGTPDQIVREVQACLHTMAKGGGYIMAPAKPIPAGTPLGNAVALVDAMVRQE